MRAEYDKIYWVLRHNKIQQELFRLTHNFSISDWRTIRTPKFWKNINGLQGSERDLFYLKCVNYYLNNY